MSLPRLSTVQSADSHRKTATAVNSLITKQSQMSINALDFGSLGDGTAILKAIAQANSEAVAGYGFAGGGQGAPRVFVPAGVWEMGTNTIDLTKTIILEGDSVGESGGGATVLKWDAGATGIRVQSGNTTGASGTQTDPGYSGAASIIRNLNLQGGYSGTEGEFHGIHLRSRASIRDCFIQNFQGDGIYMNCTATSGGATEGNANNWEVYKCIAVGNRNGIYINGADVNAGCATAFDAIGNRAWGVQDLSFLGNTWVGCHTSANASGPYKTNNVNAASVFIGCYSEGDQPPSSFQRPTLVFGGLHGAGMNTNASNIRGGNDDQGLVIDGLLTVTSQTASGGIAVRATAQPSFAMATTGGTLLATWSASVASGVVVFDCGSGITEQRHYVQGVQTLAIDGSGISLLSGKNLRVNGQQVVGARGASLPADATDLASAIALVNAIKARLKATGGHGLVSD